MLDESVKRHEVKLKKSYEDISHYRSGNAEFLSNDRQINIGCKIRTLHKNPYSRSEDSK